MPNRGENTTELTAALTAEARTFKPMDKAQVSALLAKTADAAANGEYDLFKTSTLRTTASKDGMSRSTIPQTISGSMPS